MVPETVKGAAFSDLRYPHTVAHNPRIAPAEAELRVSVDTRRLCQHRNSVGCWGTFGKV